MFDTAGRADDPPAERDTDSATAAEAALVDEIGCWERAKARAEARQLRAMAALARRPMFAVCAEHGDDDPQHGILAAASVVSAQLRISPSHARTRVELACELVECLPDTLAAGRRTHRQLPGPHPGRGNPPAGRASLPSGPSGDRFAREGRVTDRAAAASRRPPGSAGRRPNQCCGAAHKDPRRPLPAASAT